jgi:L-ascorbate metabolism protein UlaG (beta-lactamase superfamily)
MRFRFFIFLIFAVLGFSSCKIISFSESTLNDVNPEGLKLSDDCRIQSTGIVYMNLAGLIKTNFFPTSFKINYKDLLIYIDPLFVKDSLKADYIFITHVHNDHFSPDDIRSLSDEHTLIVAPEPVTKKLKGYRTKTVNAGETHDFGDIQCEIIYAYNAQKGFLGMTLHPKGNDNVGYVLSFGKERIYHAGDTDLIPEMKDLKNIHLALLPVGEGKTAMNPNTAAEAANFIQPVIAVPVHYEIGKNRVQAFTESVNTSIIIHTLRIK